MQGFTLAVINATEIHFKSTCKILTSHSQLLMLEKYTLNPHVKF